MQEPTESAINQYEGIVPGELYTSISGKGVKELDIACDYLNLLRVLGLYCFFIG